VTELECHRQLVKSLSDDLSGPDRSPGLVSGRADESAPAFDEMVSIVVSVRCQLHFKNKFLYAFVLSLCAL